MNLSFDRSFIETSIRRAVAIVLLLLIHIVVIAYFLSINVAVPSASRDVRKTFLSLIMSRPQPKIHPLPRAAGNKEKPRKRSYESPYAFAPNFVSPAIRQPDVSGLGRALFDCDLGHLVDLTDDQRANCNYFAVQPPVAGSAELGMPKTTMAKQGVRWASAIARRKAPLRAQCTYMTETPAAMTGGQAAKPILMVDMICAAKGLIDGFGPPK